MIKNLFTLPALIAILGLMLTDQVRAQTFTTVYSFTRGSARYSGGLILSGKTLYGTGGGSPGAGTVFAVGTDGTGFKTLHSFNSESDGFTPSSGLISSDNTLYGTTLDAVSPGTGTVFAVSTDGTGFTNLHTFNSTTDGAYPHGKLVLSGNTLYGTAEYGGSYDGGTVFAVNTDGTGFTNLHTFGVSAAPLAGLVLSGNMLYGTTLNGGYGAAGTVFAINTDGTGFTNLYIFTPPSDTSSDGALPTGGLVLSGNVLYGTTSGGGSAGAGTIFSINTDGTGFTTLHSFARVPSSPPFTNSDGAFPMAVLILSGNTLYGTTRSGGTSNGGTVFAINTDGTGFTNLHIFTDLNIDTNSDGAGPSGELILWGNTLYGTTVSGGNFGNGTVFSLSLGPRLKIMPYAGNVILTWPTNPAGFTLESTTNLGSPAIWTTNSSVPGLVNGQNAVTNRITGTQQFFRLSQQLP